MMKKLTTLFLLCGALATMNAQTKLMRIHYSDGSSETKQVTNVTKITFEDEGGSDVDPSVQMVDMGLSVKWAAWNVGAKSPEQYGDYFAYGEIKPKTDYTLLNYEWLYYGYLDGEDLDEWEYYLKLGANISGTNYDAAHVNWGDKWRMPSRAEWQELFNNSTKVWTSVNGVEGARFTSKINGNSIFIPAAGNKFDGKETHQGTNCMLWTPEEYDFFDPSGWNNECRNYRVDISSTYANTEGYDYPDIGFTIRPVYGDLPAEQLPTVKIPTASEAIDLGLPSGTKWAPFNIGATQSSGKGLFLCFGELTEKYYSHTYNYKYYDPLTDKCKDFGGDIQGTEYDAASVLWGDGWVTPNKEQIQELVDLCDWVSNGYGFTITGPNGNSIYLPACGQMTYMGAPRSSQESLHYMSSTESKGDSHYGILASRGYANALGAPEVKDWFAKVGAKQVRPVRK
ncbi:MAG: hypothetical protein J1E84_04365 [Muribaculaceae bacterium]|nr:hypothetical protein [Muribaculaceae bacterium]